MSKFDLEDGDESFVQRYRGWIAGFMMLAISGGVYAAARASKNAPPPPKQMDMTEVTMVKLPPPPPPPPPPPQQIEQPKEEEKMIEQEKVDEPEEKPDDAPPPAPEVTAPEGNGPNPFGLQAGKRGGGGTMAQKKPTSRWGGYAYKVQQAINSALSGNKRVRTAVFRIEAKIWADSTGRVTRASVKSTGDAELDKTIRDDVLTGLQLSESPPSDMPMPINLRLTARRP